MSGPPPSAPSATPSFFTHKKSQILKSLATSSSPSYTDKSPKGSIDTDIVDLIDLINSFPGYVTTSSCAGRVAVFVEGRKTLRCADGEPTVTDLRSAPGGKGAGNRWLYVSHSPVPLKLEVDDSTISDDVDVGTKKQSSLRELFGLTPQSTSLSISTSDDTANTDTDDQYPTAPDVRLVKLSFSPLILHILCSSLQTAKPLLAAAINAGFRESGVQSLKALDDDEAGVMVAIRTAGLAFETVVGWVDERQQEVEENQEQKQDGKIEKSEIYRACVPEGVLRMFVGVVNDRFGWNEQRRERFRALLLSIGEERQDMDGEWEDKTVRKDRKREEGLRRQKEKREERESKTVAQQNSNGQVEKVTGIEPEVLDEMDLFQETT